MVAMKNILKPGNRVRIVRQMPQRDQCWTPSAEGTLVSYRQATTGAWFAHSKSGKLWLDRAMMRMDDGELTDCALDRYTRVEAIGAAERGVSSVAANSDSDSPSAPSKVSRGLAATIFVGVLAVLALTLAVAVMPWRLVALGAFCFFVLSCWMSWPAFLAVVTKSDRQFAPAAATWRVPRQDRRLVTDDRLHRRIGPHSGVIQRRAARRHALAHPTILLRRALRGHLQRRSPSLRSISPRLS